MYMDYAKLWKLLIDRGITRTDLLEITGISSRVLAKLSKNETVTTDTLARICAALSCDVGDIMECAPEERMPFFRRYTKYGKVIEENERYKTVIFTDGTHRCRVYESGEAATKACHILCREDGGIYMEQFYAVAGPSGYLRQEHLIVRPTRNPEETVIVLLKGKPGLIAGLDANGFVSARGTKKSPSDVFVMSQTAFKMFDPQRQTCFTESEE